MKELIQKLENADFTRDEIRIETEKYILILTIYPAIGFVLPGLFDQRTLKWLGCSYWLRCRINSIFKKKEKKNGEKEKKEKRSNEKRNFQIT